MILDQLGSSLATLMFIWTMASQFINLAPIESIYTKLISRLFPEIQITIPEKSLELRYSRNKVYTAVETYLDLSASQKATKLKAGDLTGKSISLTMDVHEELTDVFHGVPLKWGFHSKSTYKDSNRYSTGGSNNKTYYTLTFHRRHRSLVVDSYLKFVMETSQAIKDKNRQRKLYTNSNEDHGTWTSVVFKHPATFDTLAIDPIKKKIMDDLVTFSKGKEYYSKIGKAWKRGYLLYGPPGTGTSTMIGAIANFLDYDVYDLELTAVKNNADLRELLLDISSKSIIMIEDIDCSLDLSCDRKPMKEPEEEQDADDDEKMKKKKDVNCSMVTLSGLLNFIDWLWSATGGERIIVFTTNHVEELDPALIRRGRMDMHIELSYCGYEAFKVLAKNYLELDSHPMFDSVRELLEEVEISPADVAEQLMPKTICVADNATGCLEELIRMLRSYHGRRMKKG